MHSRTRAQEKGKKSVPLHRLLILIQEKQNDETLD